MTYNVDSCGVVTRSQFRATERKPCSGRLRQSYVDSGPTGHVCGKPSLKPPEQGFLLCAPHSSDCSSGVIFTIGGSLKRRDDVSPNRQRVEGQSAGLTQAHEVVWPIFAACQLQGLQRRPIAIPMPQGDQNPVNSGLGLFCPEPLQPDT